MVEWGGYFFLLLFTRAIMFKTTLINVSNSKVLMQTPPFPREKIEPPTVLSSTRAYIIAWVLFFVN